MPTGVVGDCMNHGHELNPYKIIPYSTGISGWRIISSAIREEWRQTQLDSPGEKLLCAPCEAYKW